MPNILGLYPEEAEIVLKENNLHYKILPNNIYTLTYPANSIIEQNPISESVIKPGRTIYIKKNPPQPHCVKVPRLIDKSIRNVYSIVKSIGVKIGKIFYVKDIADNVIINAHIGAKFLQDDEEVPLGTVIDLVVGVNNLETEIPSFIGIDEHEIELRLFEKKLKLGKLTYRDSKNYEHGIVVNQSKIFEHVRCGTVINIEIGEKEKPKKEIEPPQKTVTDINIEPKIDIETKEKNGNEE
jgi:beta-lactam-binding protein with PASTA domain